MNIAKKKNDMLEAIKELEEDIEILQGNIAEMKEILQKIETEEDMKKYADFDIEKNLKHIELF